MKRKILAALALVALAGCAKESSATDPVAATFSAASITRMADNKWEDYDKIGISMTVKGSTTLASGNYENIPYTVTAAGDTGTFEADGTEIYLPVDGSYVDFYAYYPKSDLDTNKDIAVDVSDQSEDIDILAAKVSGASKTAPSVVFSGENAFTHQLSKLTMTMKEGDGITSLSGIKAKIKGHNTTAKFNIYTNQISDEDTQKDIEVTGVTTSTATTVEAILLPTSKISGSTIVFELSGNSYTLDTDKFVFDQGKEHSYEITLNRTSAKITGATITNWGTGDVYNEGKLDANDL